MRRTGLRFTVEGEYVETLQHLDDPDDEMWTPFMTEDLHPAGKKHITIWRRGGDSREKLTRRAVSVVDWMRGEKYWEGFCAKLFLQRKGAPIAVFEWELC